MDLDHGHLMGVVTRLSSLISGGLREWGACIWLLRLRSPDPALGKAPGWTWLRAARGRRLWPWLHGDLGDRASVMASCARVY